MSINNKPLSITSHLSTYMLVVYPQVVEFGKFEMDTWYYSPFPEPYASCHKLYICEYSLKYFRKKATLLRHLAKLKERHPPGDEIYRSPPAPANNPSYVGGAVANPPIAVFEVRWWPGRSMLCALLPGAVQARPQTRCSSSTGSCGHPCRAWCKNRVCFRRLVGLLAGFATCRAICVFALHVFFLVFV